MIGEKTLKRNAISLFSSSGIGDLGLKANDITTIIGCDILPERMNLFQHNYPEAKCFCGNIWDEKKKIIDYYRSMYKEEPFLILATPPCIRECLLMVWEKCSAIIEKGCALRWMSEIA